MWDFEIGRDLKHQVHIKLKPERKSKKKFNIPNDIHRPSRNTMEPVYTDGEFLYRVAPFSFPESEHLGRMMACVSYMYYGIGKYEIDTGRFLSSEYSHTDKATVESVFSNYIQSLSWKKLNDPYILYDLRISNGYLY